jgi:RNA polymerase sigma factor (TIGR02999 family)
METTERSEAVGRALEAARRGEDGALAALYTAVYDELVELARRHRRRWSGNETIDTTGLVHESFLRLVDRTRFDWDDQRHFFAVAAKAMRHVLIDYAAKQGAVKRGGDQRRVDLDESVPAEALGSDVLVAVGAGLDQLAQLDPRGASVFEYRFFLGLSVDETAELLAISPATVKRDWALAAAFLQLHLGS